ncbi:Unknown protein [Striga hermonthica]|uniref:Protein FAR1-RELATED SEQUENCE n=1 Tax=Striga hermonthica TaxID=68872 RepID=A0A9N7NX51_STRHE|nr:Unknown protein [Striga hermonthica]
MYGWPCKHIFVVFKDLNIEVIPPAHISLRWTKFAFSKPLFHVVDNISEECAKINDKKILLNKIWSDVHICVGLIETQMDQLVEFSRLIEEHKRTLMVEQGGGVSAFVEREERFESFVGISVPQDIRIQPPTQSKNKGSGKRMKSMKEKSIEKSQKKRRLCKTCGERVGHNARTCPKKQ